MGQKYAGGQIVQFEDPESNVDADPAEHEPHWVDAEDEEYFPWGHWEQEEEDGDEEYEPAEHSIHAVPLPLLKGW